MAAVGTQSDFSEMDNAGISKEQWKIMFISGMGFFTDAYDLFVIGVVTSLLKPIWHVGKLEESLVESTALLASAIGALLFGRVADTWWDASGSMESRCLSSRPALSPARSHLISGG